jgi:hypothetical protein
MLSVSVQIAIASAVLPIIAMCRSIVSALDAAPALSIF